jgi:hypothetical protein
MPVLTKINTNVIADDAVTSAKIPAGAVQASEIAAGGVSGADIGYLGDGSGNLSGTIANQQLHFGSAFTLTDNLTVNDNLTLGKLRDDGTGQSITGDGKTITGTGTLTMGNYIEGRQVGVDVTTRVDGLTGELGSTVTGTLGSGVTGGTGLGFVKVKMGNYQFDQGMASGTQTITGVGFQGNYIEGWVNYTGSTAVLLQSYGYAKQVGDTITQQCTQFQSDTSNSTLNNYIASTSYTASGVDANMQKFAIASFDSDGFTITNVKSGTPATVHGFSYIIYYLGDMS